MAWKIFKIVPAIKKVSRFSMLNRLTLNDIQSITELKYCLIFSI
jgi:hypothetical protein